MNMSAPQTSLHYAAGGNFSGAEGDQYAPGVDGFNLADVSSVWSLNHLPAGVKGLVWLGTSNGADANFQSLATPFLNNPNLYGFYLADEPDPTGQWGTQISAANLKSQSDWIHAHAPGAKTFMVMMNMGTPDNPSYANTYNPANTDIDLFGLDPYPFRPQFANGADYGIIGAAVSAAEASGIPLSQIVPVYQSFGGGGYSSWTMPTAAQAQQMLQTWGSVVPSPAFDYTYSWGSQQGDQSLSGSPALQQVFAAHNAGSGAVDPTPPPVTPPVTPPPTASGTTMTATDTKGVTASVPVITSGWQDVKDTLAGTVHQSVVAGVDTVSATSAITSETVHFGSGTQAMSFIGMQPVTVTGGSGTDTVKGGSGADKFIAGTGALDITGGAGKDAYVFHAGAGVLKIEDFSFSGGDSLTVDKALKPFTQQASDGHGGTMLTFGATGHGVDIANMSSLSSAQMSKVHYA
jgi:Ca2+-binding RTX toxin-like protein